MTDKQKLKNELLLSPLYIALYIGIYLIFFGVFGIKHFQMRNFSRTSGVTLLTFTVLIAMMVSVYGGYDIGKRKSKPVISSLILAVFITDLVTYIAFQIMNASDQLYGRLTLFGVDFLLLLLILLVQAVFIVVMVKVGNKLYFTLYPPEKCCVVVNSQKMADHMIGKIETLKLQYKVETVVFYKYSKIKKVIGEHESIFFGDVPSTERAKLLESN